MRRIAVWVAVAAVAALPVVRAVAAEPFEAGAAKEQITPFTVIPAAEADGSHAKTSLHPGSVAAASNPDGLPGGDLAKPMPERSYAAFDGQVTSTGMWGERYIDSNSNGRYDALAGDRSEGAELFVDDLGNTLLDPDSAAKYDGIYMAGFGNDRMALGAIDPIWARVAAFKQGGRTFAIASLDLLGYFSDWTDRIVTIATSLWYEKNGNALPLDDLILVHTHDHASVDTHVGIWGPNIAIDGTYPKFERYIERKIAISLVHALEDLRPVSIRAGSIRPGQFFTTPSGASEDLSGMQSRNSCRTPWFFDDELRALAAFDQTGAPVVQLVNWSTHVESLEDENNFISSDHAGAARSTVEQSFGGGVAVYLPGAQGAVEIVGDSCTSRWTRNTFDGTTYGDYGRDRTYAIGRVVGSAALAALSGATSDPSPELDWIEPRTIYFPITNEALAALGAKGVIDKPAYVAESVSVGKTLSDATDSTVGTFAGLEGITKVYAFRLGPASFVTAPGELFPELYYGVDSGDGVGGQSHRRDTRIPGTDYGASVLESYLECSADADTGRPPEPAIRPAQEARFSGASVHFLLGYSPDLYGYIVPGYDFYIYGVPAVSGMGLPVPGPAAVAEGPESATETEVPDPCAGLDVDASFPGIHYNRHYQETVSGSSMLAPAYACTAVEMMDVDTGANAACKEWRGWKGLPGKVHNPTDPSDLPDPDDPGRAFVRHY
jgi:hypothetical protein